MSIHKPTAPPDSLSTLTNTLALYSNRPLGGLSGLLGASAQDVSTPHAVYDLRLDDLTAGVGIKAAKLIAWRYLINGPSGIPVAAEVRVDDQGKHKFGSFNEGRLVVDTELRLKEAEKDPKLGGEYDLRLLRIPALYVVALWLKGRAGAADQFLPIGDVRPPLTAGKAYGIADLESYLRPVAIAREKATDIE